MIEHLADYYFYTDNFLKIKTKVNGLQDFKLREYQRNFRAFYDDIKGPIRIYALKPRQAGFSTEVASFFSHKMFTEHYYTGIAMADKKGRTQAIGNIYSTFLQELPHDLKPMISLENTEQIHFDNPIKKARELNPGLSSGIVFETANDPNAGRSTSRKFAHLSEAAFYRYANEIDEGVQNSIPLAEGTAIIKESTANGKGGIGKAFYEGYNAAKRGESAYKAFFVAWYEIDDYALEPEYGFRKTQEEIEIQRNHKAVTDANLMWRRLKVLEYSSDPSSLLSPQERFKQDFPLNDIEAFLSTGSPIFDPFMLEALLKRLQDAPPRDIKEVLQIKSHIIKMFFNKLKIFAPPREERQYFIGADIAEGLAVGDSSSVYVMDSEYNQAACWHGKIDPDLFGNLLIALGVFYKNALLIPEVNNMGHTTVTTIRNDGYHKLYREVVEDKITKIKTEKLGWRTTEKSKNTMLNEAVALFREGGLNIKDKHLLDELALITREENGKVVLNGRDRVVAFCLAIMGRKQMVEITDKPRKPREVIGTLEENMRAFELKNRKKDDMFK